MKTNKNIIAYHTNIALAVFGMSLFVFLMSVFFVQTDFHFSKVITIAKHVVHAEDGGGGDGGGGGGGGGDGSGSADTGTETAGVSSGEVGAGCCGGDGGSADTGTETAGVSSGEVGAGCCGGGSTDTSATDSGNTAEVPPVWTIYCTGGSDASGNNWQWWQYDDSSPANYRYVRPGDGSCLPPAPSITGSTCDAAGTVSYSWSSSVGAASYHLDFDPHDANYSCPAGWTKYTQNGHCYAYDYSGTSVSFPGIIGYNYDLKVRAIAKDTIHWVDVYSSWTFTSQSCTPPPPTPAWTTFCTGGSDVNGNNWQWWQHDDSSPVNYRYVRPGDGSCLPPPPPPPTVDVCPNIVGDQTTIPDGLIKDSAGNCVPPPVDVCPNISGDQATIPAGLIKDSAGNCVPPPVDVCPNISGDQATIPAGLIKDSAGNCVPPPVCPIAPPIITSQLTASGTVGAAFSYTITTSGGTPVTVTIGSTGSIPPGLTFDPVHLTISGTPTTAGTFNAIITATNACGSDVKTLIITIASNPICPVTPPLITSSLTASGTTGVAFSYVITTSGGTPVDISIAGTLPAGLTYNAASTTISGTPTSVETKNITITAHNPCGTDTQTLVITTAPAGCTVNCGGGGGGGPSPAPVFLYKVATTSSPLASASIYLSQIPYTGFGDSALIFLFLAGLALFSYNLVMYLSKRKWSLFSGAQGIEYQKVFMAPQVAAQFTAPPSPQPSASEIAREMSTVFATILKEQNAQKAAEPVHTAPQVTATEIAQEVGTVVSGIFDKQIAPHIKTAVEEKAPVTINVSIGNIHVGNNVTNTTTNNQLPPVAEPVKVEAPKIEPLVTPKEVATPANNQVLMESLRGLANDERILISPIGFDIVATEGGQESAVALKLLTKLIDEAKATYPRQHGWIELNKEKITSLLETIKVSN